MRLIRNSSIVILFVLVASARAESDDWPRWRGPADNGCARPGDYPVKWDAAANIAWKAPLPGKGSSTPIVWRERIYLTCPANGQDAVLAFDAHGKPLWQTPLGAERKGKHRNGSGSNPSPATDGQRLFVYFKSGRLAALDLDGKPLWQTNLQERFGKDTLYWDIGSSPVLTAVDVVVAVLHQGESYLAAFNQQSGQLRWKIARNYQTPIEGEHSYATPIVLRQNGREAILVWGGAHLTAHDAADGAILWSCGNFNPDQEKLWPAVGSPVVVDDVAVVPYGRGNRLHGVRLGGRGDVTATHRLWTRDDTGTFVTTPAAGAGRAYLLRDRGELECIDPRTGKTLFRGELPKDKSNYYASPLLAGGKLYAVREDGVAFVVQADQRFTLLAENPLGERIIASPVPLTGRILFRGEKHLFCVGKPKRLFLSR